jgi:hypothetical protein
MTTLKAYGRTLWDLQQTVCNRMGFDLRRTSVEVRAVVICIDATFALLINALVTKGVFTDLELNAAVQAVRNTPFSTLGPQPYSPDEAPPVPDPLLD